jgi:hypothetical protein
LAWGYTHGPGNLDVDVIGAADSLTRDVMLAVMLIVGVVIDVVVLLLSAWIGVGGNACNELLKEGDNDAMIQKK